MIRGNKKIILKKIKESPLFAAFFLNPNRKRIGNTSCFFISFFSVFLYDLQEGYMSVFIHGPQHKTAKGPRGIPSGQGRAGGREGAVGREGGGRDDEPKMAVCLRRKVTFHLFFSFPLLLFYSSFSSRTPIFYLFVNIFLYFRNSPLPTVK